MECEPSTSTTAVVYKRRSARIANKSKRRCGTGHSALTLDSLPEDVLLELFSYLNSSDLSNLCVCSSNIGRICQDYRLWRRIRDCCNGSKPNHDPLLSIINDSTTRIDVSAERKLIFHTLIYKDPCLGQNFFKKLQNAPNLESFILKSHSFDRSMFRLDYFPQSLTELRLNNCHIFCDSLAELNALFLDMNEKLPNLEILDVSHCRWIYWTMLEPIFQCAKIKTLILFACYRLYIPVTFFWQTITSAIFSSLETMDLRQTKVPIENLFLLSGANKLKHIFVDYIETQETAEYWFKEDVYKCFDNIETLVVRNNKCLVTDFLLKKLATDCQSLKYLDVTNTLCTDEGVSIFKSERPNVELLHESIQSNE